MSAPWRWFRWARQVLGVVASVSESQSSLVVDAWAVNDDGVTPSDVTVTLKDANGNPVVGVPVTLTVSRILIDAAACTLDTDDAEIETTTGLANITAYIYDTDGNPVVGIPTASLSLASTGSNNTITPV